MRTTLLVLACCALSACASAPASRTEPAAPAVEAKAAPAEQAPAERADGIERMQAGPPFAPIWCTRSEQIPLAEIALRHLPGAQVEPFDSRCDPSVIAKRAGIEAKLNVRCGTHAYEHASDRPRKDAVHEPALDARVYRFAPVLPEGSAPASALFAWDDDTPCIVGATWEAAGTDEARKPKLDALAADALRALTPAAIAHPVAELVLMAEDTTDALPRKALQTWSDRATVAAQLGPLAPGYPKIIQGDDYPGLPSGKHYLLFAVCPSQRGKNLATALEAFFVGPPFSTNPARGAIEHFPIDGLGRAIECPGSDDGEYIPFDAGSRFIKLDDGRTITVAALGDSRAAPGSTRTRVAALLFARDGALLDSELLRFEQPALNPGPCTARFFNDPDRAGFGVFCKVAPPGEICDVLPNQGDIQTVSATADNQLVVRRTTPLQPGQNCREPR